MRRSRVARCCTFRLVTHAHAPRVRPPIIAGSKIMLPLTQSLYVPGRVAGGGAVLVDIGTGYYAEKSVPSAQDMIERKARRSASPEASSPVSG